MLVDDSRTRELVRRAVRRWVREPSLQEDLIQQALIHLWLIEEQRPGQTRSWYFESCRYHVLNCLRCGSSVDSHKRRNRRIAISSVQPMPAPWQPAKTEENPVICQVSARDIVELLGSRLRPLDNAILRFLADGLGPRDIAARMNVTHQTILKRRRRIAALAIQLGIAPVPANGRLRNDVRRPGQALKLRLAEPVAT
jgi:DNA-directed RNA polymerase specialized sigma24 family protein